MERPAPSSLEEDAQQAAVSHAGEGLGNLMIWICTISETFTWLCIFHVPGELEASRRDPGAGDGRHVRVSTAGNDCRPSPGSSHSPRTPLLPAAGRTSSTSTRTGKGEVDVDDEECETCVAP